MYTIHLEGGDVKIHINAYHILTNCADVFCQLKRIYVIWGKYLSNNNTLVEWQRRETVSFAMKKYTKSRQPRLIIFFAIPHGTPF